jgi:hypothetical protein
MGMPKARASPKSAIFKTSTYGGQLTIAIDQEVLRFEIPVDDPPGVAEVNAIDQLEHEGLDFVSSDCSFID